MAFSSETSKGMRMDFRFVSRTTFDGLVENRKLAPGTFYFLEEKEFHIAIDDDQYLTYGNGLSIEDMIYELLQVNDVSNVIQKIINDLFDLINNEEFINQFIDHITNLTFEQIADQIRIATNEAPGVVKSHGNNTSETWHYVTVAPDGTMSINKEFLEAKIGQGGGGGGVGGGPPIDKMVAEPDGSTIGTIQGRNLVAQDTRPTRYGVVKCGKNCVCYPKDLSLKSMDGMLVADLKQDVNLFYPMVFAETMPPRAELFDKLTFIAKGSDGKTNY
jgi:hypothetical protein